MPMNLLSSRSTFFTVILHEDICLIVSDLFYELLTNRENAVYPQGRPQTQCFPSNRFPIHRTATSRLPSVFAACFCSAPLISHLWTQTEHEQGKAKWWRSKTLFVDVRSRCGTHISNQQHVSKCHCNLEFLSCGWPGAIRSRDRLSPVDWFLAAFICLRAEGVPLHSEGDTTRPLLQAMPSRSLSIAGIPEFRGAAAAARYRKSSVTDPVRRPSISVTGQLEGEWNSAFHLLLFDCSPLKVLHSFVLHAGL